MGKEPRSRPIGVVIRASLIIFVGAILTVLATIGVLAAVAAVQLGVADPQLLFLAILALAFSIIVLVAGIGLYNLRPWAWWLAVIALVLQLVSALGRSGVRWSPLLWENLSWLIPAFSLVYLVTVRRRFR